MFMYMFRCSIYFIKFCRKIKIFHSVEISSRIDLEDATLIVVVVFVVVVVVMLLE